MNESHDETEHSPELQYFRREVRGLAKDLGMNDPPLKLAERIFNQGMNAGVPVTSWSRYSAACLLTAAKLQDFPISDDRFATGSRNTKKSLVKKVQQISKHTGLQVTPRDPEPYLKKYMDELGVSDEVRKRAFEIAEEAREDILGGGIAPTSYAAAVLYLSSIKEGEELTQSDIAGVSGKSMVTIRNRYQDIVQVIDSNPKLRQGRNPPGEDE